MRTLLLSLSVTLAVFAQSPAPAPLPPDVSVQKDVSYGQYPQDVLDIFQPKEQAAQKRPGLLFIHGGGWVNGSKESVVEKFVLPFVQHGFVVANVEYRLAKVAPAPAAVQDVLQAAKWFHDHAKEYNVDPKRIVVAGGSAGGHLALMVGMTPKSANLGPVTKVAAVINFYGITDVQDQIEGPNMRQYAATWVPEQENRRELARRLSPQSYVRKDIPPILTIHGTADGTVPYDQGVELTRELRKAGADAEMISVPNGGHGFPPEQMQKLYPQIFEFLRRHGILTS